MRGLRETIVPTFGAHAALKGPCASFEKREAQWTGR